MLGKLGCEVPQEHVQDWKTGSKMNYVNLWIQVVSAGREGQIDM